MALMVLDPAIEERLKAERDPWRADRYDEVWDGMYVIVSRPDNEHGGIQTGIATALSAALGWDSPGSRATSSPCLFDSSQTRRDRESKSSTATACNV